MQAVQETQLTRERASSLPGDLLSADEVGRRLGIDVSTVYRMAGDGRLSAIKVGRQWRFPVDAIPVMGSDSPIDVSTAEAVAAVAADLLGAMVVITDLEGRPMTSVHNPCERYRQASTEAAEACVQEWRDLAARNDFVPRFHRGALDFDCAAAFIRAGDRLVGLVIAGGVAPLDEPAPDVHVLTKAQRSLVLDSLPRIAAAVVERRTP
jgi:excisionase family DNA binding protein